MIGALLPRGRRSYVVIISNKTIKRLTPITFQNLPEAARIGVIGHELSHVVDFSRKTTWQSLLVAAGHFSKRYMASLEFNTDKICIDHGLGEPLYNWSSYIRQTMNTTNWRGVDFVFKPNRQRERYMNPGTISKYIDVVR